MAITSGTHHFGPGEALEDWSDLASEINSQTLTGEVVFIQTGPITQSSLVTFSGVIQGSNSIQFTGLTDHFGRPTASLKTTFTSTGGIRFTSGTQGAAGYVDFNRIYLEQSVVVNCLSIQAALKIRLRHLLVRGTADPSLGALGIHWNNPSAEIYGYNIKCWGFYSAISEQNLAAGSLWQFENVIASSYNNVFDMRTGPHASSSIRNSFGIRGSQGSCFTLSTNQSYCASTDATASGTGSRPNTVAANVLISTSDSSANFYNLSTGSVLGQAGISPLLAGNTLGIRGNDRPGTDGNISIGADEITPPGSVTIGTGSYNMLQWPTSRVIPSILWTQNAAGYWMGSDRGAAQDIYEADCVFVDKEYVINELATVLEEHRESLALEGLPTSVFSPNVDHSGTLTVTAKSIRRRHIQYGVPSATSQVYALEVTFRAISPTLLATTPSLSTLKLQEGFEASPSYEMGKAFSFDQTAFYTDHGSDIGRFEGVFRQTTAQARAILAYLLTTARANAVTFPSIGVTYPFGVSRGPLPMNCKVKSFEISRQNFVFWDLKIEFVEHA